MRELATAQQRTDEDLRKLTAQVAELSASHKELTASHKELAASHKELAASQKELTAAQNQTEKELRNLARQVGGLSEAFGGSLEDFAIDLVPELLEKYWGMVVADAGRDSVQVNGAEYDFDLVIRGTIDHRPLVVLGEVKSNLTLAEVKTFLLLTAKAASSLKQEVRTIFFGYRAEKAARDLIKDQGAYMVFTHGKLL